MACLYSEQVRHKIGEDKDEDDNPTIKAFKKLQQQNDMCVSLLNQQGCAGDKLKATLKEKVKQENQVLTVPHSQERVDAIMHCKTHGQSFMATGGMPITADETFLAAEQEKKKSKIREIHLEKKKRLEAERRETLALKLIEREIQDKDLKVDDLNVLLGWHQIKINGNKTQKLIKWQSIREK